MSIETPDDLMLVDRVKVARLQVGDVLVLEYPGIIDQDASKRLGAFMEQTFPGHRCIVLEQGMTLKVASVAEKS